MISVDEARAAVLAGLSPLGAETVPLALATGRVLAEDMAARVSHPPAAVSSMDGYAVRAEDVAACPVRLRVTGTAQAGGAFTGEVKAGTCARIFTGAPVPNGADAVVMQEDTRRDGDTVDIQSSAPVGRFIRPAGMDFQAGELLLRAGTRLGGRAIALAAAMNLPHLPVRRRPRVAVLSTGDEIAQPGDPLGPAQIPGSNGPGLCALIQALGGEPVHLGIARDSRESLDSMIAAARGVDLLVTSGGASVGDYDLVQDALKDAGMALSFHKVAMRPGKPLMLGELRGIKVLGLPGNPVAAMVTAMVFLAPALRALQGLSTELETVPAVLGADLPANDLRQDFLRAGLERGADGTLTARGFTLQDSAALAGLARADALIIRPPHAPPARAGETVPVMPLPEGS